MIVPDMPLLWTVWIGSALLWLGLSVLVLRREKLPKRAGPWIILGVAAAVRLGYVGLMPPVLSDDVWRYLYDGQTLAAGNNPYVHAPLEEIEQLETAGQAESQRWLTWINNPELVTIYQPTSQLGFAAITKLSDAVAGRDAGAMTRQRVFRAVFSLFDLLVIAMLISELRRRGRSVWWAVVYGWNPLVLCETAWSGHQDVMGIAAMIAALLLAQRAGDAGRSGWWRTAAAGVLLGVAAGVKPIVLPLALPLAWQLKDAARGWSRVGMAAAACTAALACLYLPFVLMDGGMSGMFETSRHFVSTWRFNGSLHALLESAAGRQEAPHAKAVADVASGAALLVVLVAATWRYRDVWRAAAAFMFALVCFTSTAHPWYLLWVMALLPMAWSAGRRERCGAEVVGGVLAQNAKESPGVDAAGDAEVCAKRGGGFAAGPAVWVASVTLPWSYVAWAHYANGGAFDGEYQPGLGATWAVWLPVYGALGWALWRGWRGKGVGGGA